MTINWKRFTLGALMLASLSLFLFGCGGGGGEGSSTKTVSGVVSNPATGLRLPNVQLAVYPIGANGQVGSTAIGTATSDGSGNFSLSIPESYTGRTMVVATTPNGPVRAITGTMSSGQPGLSQVMVSRATEMVVQYIQQNKSGAYTPENTQASILVLEPFFGIGFPQTPPPAVGGGFTAPTSTLLVMTQAVNALVTSGETVANLVTINGTSGIINLGTEPTFSQLNAAIATVTNSLVNAGLIPGGFTVTPVPVPEPPLTDTTPPSAPGAVSTTTTALSVALTWGAATDNTAVTAYLVYRDGTLISTVAGTVLTYTDTTVQPGKTYTYAIVARDAAGNISAATPSGAVTTPQPPPINVFTISGRITLNGSALPNVAVSLSGFGAGSTVTDANGVYSFSGAVNGNYTITPSAGGYAFTPASRPVTIANANSASNDFTATADGSVTGGTTYPGGNVTGGVVYPPGTVIGGVTYPSGLVIGGTSFPNGVVIGGVTYPSATIVGGTVYPNGVVIGGVTYPAGTIIGGTIFPNGVIVGGVTYPTGSFTGQSAYPDGIVIGGVTYPAGSVIGAIAYPAGSVAGGITFIPPSTGISITW